MLYAVFFFKQKYNYLYYTGVAPPERVPKAKALGGGGGGLGRSPWEKFEILKNLWKCFQTLPTTAYSVFLEKTVQDKVIVVTNPKYQERIRGGGWFGTQRKWNANIFTILFLVKKHLLNSTNN